MSSVGTKNLHPAVAELLERRRLGSLEESRHRFTVSREDALVQLRAEVKAREHSRWAWALALVVVLVPRLERRFAWAKIQGSPFAVAHGISTRP